MVIPADVCARGIFRITSNILLSYYDDGSDPVGDPTGDCVFLLACECQKEDNAFPDQNKMQLPH